VFAWSGRVRDFRVLLEERYPGDDPGKGRGEVGMNKNDPVERPAHYSFGRFEVIDVIEDWGLGFHLGNVVKYVARAPHKGEEVQDLKKALWYLQRHIKLTEGKNGKS